MIYNGTVFKNSDVTEANCIILEHLISLPFPIESYLEQTLYDSDIFLIVNSGCEIGYASISGDVLTFFYVKTPFFRMAPLLLEKIINEKSIKTIQVITQDIMLCSLITQWDYQIEREGCLFTDTEKVKPVLPYSFTVAKIDDIARIRVIADDFFDEPSGGYNNLKERIDNRTIFMLKDGSELLGCGVAEISRLNPQIVSVGMFTAYSHRKKGVGREILAHIKEWAYESSLKPIAGCWYYNTVSRKTLESAGFTASAIILNAHLTGKEELPLLTGNPPGVPAV